MIAGLRRLLLLFALAALPALAQQASGASAARQNAEDFDAMWRAVDKGYAYFDRSRVAWRRARDVWRPRAARARSRPEFVAALERALDELHDDHVGLSERTAASPRRVPADTDIWAFWKDGAAVVEAIRTYGEADVAGLRPGHVVTRIAGLPVERAVREQLGGGAVAGAAARDWALRHALVGPRSGALRLEVREGRGMRRLEILRDAEHAPNAAPLIGRRMGEDRDLGYIRIKAPLSEPRLPETFDGALHYLKDTRALILDLREVSGPSFDTLGIDTLRIDRLRTRAGMLAILGRFAPRPSPWQIRESRGGERATDTVAPRGATPYSAPLVVLVDRWTASEGEALAAGLHAVAQARLVGTPMAGLRGELTEVRLPHSGILVRFPGERVFHVDGTPREALKPTVPVDLANPQGGPGDPILYQALKLLERK